MKRNSNIERQMYTDATKAEHGGLVRHQPRLLYPDDHVEVYAFDD